MANALITGINGFTGRYLADALREVGYVVSGTGLIRTHGQAYDYYHCDLCDRATLLTVLEAAKPEVIVHLAGIAHVEHGDVEGMYRTNIFGTRNLLDVIASSTVTPRAILIASSANVYGNVNCDSIDEGISVSPANDYAVSKLAMEYAAKLWMNRLPITIVRPFNYTGVGQSEDFLLPKIVGHFRRRAPVIELGNLQVVRDFSDVRMVVGCYRKLLEASIAERVNGEIFNICSGSGYELLDILKIVGELAGYAPKVRVNPQFVRNNELTRLVGSQAKLESAIGPVPTIKLAETLRWMYESEV